MIKIIIEYYLLKIKYFFKIFTSELREKIIGNQSKKLTNQTDKMENMKKSKNIK